MGFFSNKLVHSFALSCGINTVQLVKEFFIFLQSCNLIIIWKKTHNLKFSAINMLQVRKLKFEISQYETKKLRWWMKKEKKS